MDQSRPRFRPALLVLTALVALTAGALLPAVLAGSEEIAVSPAPIGESTGVANPFEATGGEAEAQSCGGPGQRACCALEGPACANGLAPVALGQFPTACTFGADTCMPKAPVTACGGEGQRACCAIEAGALAAACQPGLVLRPDDLALDLFVPVSGDATCAGAVIVRSTTARSTGSCIKASPDPISEPVAGWSPPAEPRGLLRGYLDMHLHLLGDMAHGGKNLVGQPAPKDAGGNFVVDADHNVNTALSAAADLRVHKNPYHGLFNDTSGDGTGDGSRTEFGAPYFSGWPKWTSTTHQQTYYVWLERAWRGGLRTTTLFASHVESLCKTSLKATRATSWPICEDSMLHIVNQLQAAYDFQNFVDGLNGGTGQGWFRIVRTPQQARDAMRAGKLAVVLGIEVDNLFNCKEAGCPADFGLPLARIGLLSARPAPTTLAEAVDVIYDMGVRQVFPIHNFDNGFGAAATWLDPIGVGQAVAEQRWWVTRDCGNGRGDYGFWLDNAIQSIMLILGFGVGETPAIPVYTNGNLEPTYASCNQYGLRPLGADLVHALMNKGMLIDIDHMGANSLNDVITITSAGLDGNGVAYPLLASHVQPFDLHQQEFVDNKGRHERMRTAAQLAAIRSSGGMVAAMLKDDVQDTDLKGRKFTFSYSPVAGGAITDNCRHSSKSWAQAFQYAVDAMGGPVAMGSDFNGAAGHLGPRFGSDACGGWGAPNNFERPLQVFENNRVQYPFTLPGFGSFDQQVTGFKAFDYNVDGLAHIGMLPDMMADLERIGLSPHYVDALFCSGEAYIRVWERAEALAARRPAPNPNRPWLCNVTNSDSTAPSSSVSLAPAASSTGWYRSDVAATITATDADSGVERIDHSVTGGTPGHAIADVAAVTIVGEGDRTLTYFATDNAGNVEAPNSVAVRIDRTAPGIDASGAPAANAAGWNNSAVTATFSCTDALSGIETCAAPQLLNAEGAGQSATGDAVDNAGNSTTAAVTVNIDLTAPAIGASRAPAANAAGWNNSAVAITFSCSDGLSGISTCASPQFLGGDGAGQSATGGALDNAGNGATATATGINIDRTAPGIAASNSPAANAAGWNNTPVTVTFNCSDALSGIAACAAAQLLTVDGAGQSAAGDAIDNAGNSATATSTGVNIDRTAPVVAVTGVTNGAIYSFGAVPPAGCSTSDALSGVDTSAIVAVTGGTTNGVGTFTVACTGARDVAGNTASRGATYEVHYVFTGFMNPISNLPTVNIVRAGQTVPVKFGLGGAFGLDVLQGGYATSANIGCSAGSTVDLTEVAATYPGASLFGYDATTGLYQFNWQTDRTWAGRCRRLLVRLDDGTVHSADFRLR